MIKLFRTLNVYEQTILILETYIVITLLIIIPIFNINNIHLTELSDNVCYWYQLGYHCIGCGGTRAVDNILHFHFLRSLFYCPAVFYGFIILALQYISFIVYFITKGNKKIFSLKPEHASMIVFLLLLYFFIKNIFSLYFSFNIYELIE